MFGKSLFSLIKGALVLGVILLLGSTILSNIVLIVEASRSGDFTQLALLCILTGIAVRVEGAYSGDGKMIGLGLRLFAVIMTVFIVGVVFFIALAGGLVFSISSVVVTVVVLTAWRDPSSITDNLGPFLGNTISSYISSPDSSSVLNRSMEKLGMRVLVLPDGCWSSVLGLLRDRPQLPVALVHFMEQDVLVVKSKDSPTWMRKTRELLEERGVTGTKEASQLFTRTVLAMPVLLEKGPSKVSLDQYRVVRDKETVAIVLAQMPANMVVHPSTSGLVVVVLADDVFGLDTDEIPRQHILKVLIGRDISVLGPRFDHTGGENNTN